MKLVLMLLLFGSVCWGQPYVVLDQIWNEEELLGLRTMWQEFGAYQTVREDATSAIPHIGEMVPAVDGICPHRYLTGRIIEGKLQCVLPDRIDVAHHHFKSGGISGRKEKFETMVGRLLAFNKILHRNFTVKSLFNSPKYLEAVATICPGRPVVDPIQLGIIVLVPGQEVAVHYDVPWFKGSTRYDIPQWLLVAMHRSHLFDTLLTPQIQGVAYIHEQNTIEGDLRIKDEEFRTGSGDFVFWTDNTTSTNALTHHSIPATPNTGIVLDGSLIPHGVYPFGTYDTPSLKMHPQHQYELRSGMGSSWINSSWTNSKVREKESSWTNSKVREKESSWTNSKVREKESSWTNSKVREKESSWIVWDVTTDQPIGREYGADEMRVSLVWRSRCFESEAEREAWHAAPKLDLSTILETLKADLRQKGIAIESDISALDLALLIIDTYIIYPKSPTAWIPWNYCLLDTIYPSLHPLISLLCS